MQALDIISQPILTDMEHYRSLFLSALTSDNAMLNMALKHIARRSGKMMRPKLMMLCARYCGKPLPNIYHVAVALELLHTASLIHDDVVDQADQRRGQDTIHTIFGNKEAILVGDYLLGKAMMHGSMSNDLRVIQQISWLGQQLADGELLQLDLTHQEDFNQEQYYRVIDCKTGSLFQVSATLGAILSQYNNQDQKLIHNMGRFGLLLGRAFQLRDDIFDYDIKNQTGKPTGNDMREGKLTLPLLYVLNTSATQEQKDIALRIRNAEATEEEIQSMLSLAKTGGGIDYAKNEMYRLVDQALELIKIKRDHTSQDIFNSLQAYAYYVTGREL